MGLMTGPHMSVGAQPPAPVLHALAVAMATGGTVGPAGGAAALAHGQGGPLAPGRTAVAHGPAQGGPAAARAAAYCAHGGGGAGFEWGKGRGGTGECEEAHRTLESSGGGPEVGERRRGGAPARRGNGGRRSQAL